MGFIGSLISSFRKSRQLRQLSLILGNPMNVQFFMEEMHSKGGSKKDRALQQLFELCETDPRLAPLLRGYGASRATLEELYTRLLATGAGQWVRGHWVAASALAFPATLDYLLRKQRDDLKDEDEVLEVTFQLVEYFEKGKVGHVK